MKKLITKLFRRNKDEDCVPHFIDDKCPKCDNIYKNMGEDIIECAICHYKFGEHSCQKSHLKK